MKVRAVLAVLVGLALVCGYWQMLSQHLPVAFRDLNEDLSYAWYVPVFSAYVVWRERQAIVRSIGNPSGWGVLLALPFLFVGFLGVRGIQLRFEIVGFVGLLAATVLALFGRETLKRTAFPILFLLFCLPLHSFLDVVTVHLRLFAVAVAESVLHGFGVGVVRQGTMLVSPSGAFAIDVAEPCSGIRSLFALLALTAGYAYFTQRTWIRRGVLFALAVPIAIVGNVVRILTIVLVAAYCSAGFALGFYHDYSGYVVFLVAIFLMAAAGAAVAKGGRP